MVLEADEDEVVPEEGEALGEDVVEGVAEDFRAVY